MTFIEAHRAVKWYIVFAVVGVVLWSQVQIEAPTGLAISVDGKPIGTANTLNLVSGYGVQWVCSQSGAVMNCGASEDTAVMLSRTMDQAGTDESWVSSSHSATAYTAAAVPSLTVYTPNMSARWVPDVNCGAAPALSVGGLGPIALKKVSTGAIVPLAAGDCVATVPYVLRAHGNPVDAFIMNP